MEKVINLDYNGRKIKITQPKGFTMLSFKFEYGKNGPLYWTDGKSKAKNFLDSNQKQFSGGFQKYWAEWFSLKAAKDFATFFQVPLEIN